MGKKIISSKELFKIKHGDIIIRSNYNDEILIKINTKDSYKIDIDTLTKNNKIVGIIVNNKIIYGEDNYIEIIDKYGTDGLRFSLVLGITAGNDIRYMPEKLDQASNFANKLWNASKFALGNFEKVSSQKENFEEYMTSEELPSNLAYEDKWILSKINTLAKEVATNIDKYDIGVACSKIYDFIWNEFCDWYIEMVIKKLEMLENNI